jgi:hypothetical protein
VIARGGVGTLVALVLAVLPVAGALGTGAAGLSAQSRLYAELAPVFKTFHPALTELAVLAQQPIDARYAVMIVRAAVPEDRLVKDFSKPEALKQETFGVFVIDRRSGARHMTVDLFATRSWRAEAVRIHDVTDRHLIVAREGGTYGTVRDKVRYLWSLEGGAVTARLPYIDLRLHTLAEFDGSLYAVGTRDDATSVIVRAPTAPAGASAYEIVDRIDGRPLPMLHLAVVESGALTLTGDTARYVLQGGRWRVEPNPDAASFRYSTASGAALGLPGVSFWVPGYRVRQHLLPVDDAARRVLVWNKGIAANGHGGPATSGVYELGAAGPRFHQFPQPAFDLFAKYRPARVQAGYTRDFANIETEVGPFQLEGRRLWFGTAFYDGEGTTGVGGVGSFEIDSGRWEVFYEPAMAEWSSSAILVENRAVWLGLMAQPEGAAYAGGLLRYDRNTRAMRRIDVPGIIHVIRRVGPSLYLATDKGLYIYTGEGLKHVDFLPDPDGRTAVSVRAIAPAASGRLRYPAR